MEFINDIVNGTINFFTNIGQGVSQVKNAIKSIFDLIQITIEFIPQPFLNITLIFLPILLGSIIIKLIRG